MAMMTATVMMAILDIMLELVATLMTITRAAMMPLLMIKVYGLKTF